MLCHIGQSIINFLKASLSIWISVIFLKTQLNYIFESDMCSTSYRIATNPPAIQGDMFLSFCIFLEKTSGYYLRIHEHRRNCHRISWTRRIYRKCFIPPLMWELFTFGWSAEMFVGILCEAIEYSFIVPLKNKH